ncbi:hypothetical protein SESBI_05825 [Sesbania bispinosa]|nr:hypothetical protein SESBI_05825 [Sesbania bispinosa]
MEDYLLRNKGVFPVTAFKATSWDITFGKDPGDCPGAERDVSARLSNEPGFSIVSMKPLPGKPSEPWPDQGGVKVKNSESSRIVQKPSRLAEEGSSQSEGSQKQPEGETYVLRSEHTTLQRAY